MHIIIEVAQHFEEWKDIIEPIVDRHPELFDQPNRDKVTPAMNDVERSFGISRFLDEKEKALEKILEKETKKQNMEPVLGMKKQDVMHRTDQEVMLVNLLLLELKIIAQKQS